MSTVSVVVLWTVMAFIAPARAQICSDADGSGATSLTDGVQILRAAAGLSTKCSETVCDVDGNGVVSVSDGMLSLARAAQLPAAVSCGTRFGALVKAVQANGVLADLHLGTPPTSSPGAPVDVLSVDGSSEVQSGQSARLTVRLDRRIDTLIVGFQENGIPVDGFAQLPTGDASIIDLILDTADVPGGAAAEVVVGTVVGAQVGGFQRKPFTVVGGSSVTLSVTGDANIFGAGHGSPPAPAGRGAGSLPPVVTLPPGNNRVVSFEEVTGTVSCCNGDLANGPNGGTAWNTNIEGTGGISGIDHPGMMFLTGVFLDDAEPPGQAAGLGQPFFVGDGQEGNFAVPPEATRLFLGFADAVGFAGPVGAYADNSGTFSVKLRVTVTP